MKRLWIQCDLGREIAMLDFIQNFCLVQKISHPGLTGVKNMSRLVKKLDSNLMRLGDWNGLYRSVGGLVNIATALRKLSNNQASVFD